MHLVNKMKKFHQHTNSNFSPELPPKNQWTTYCEQFIELWLNNTNEFHILGTYTHTCNICHGVFPSFLRISVFMLNRVYLSFESFYLAFDCINEYGFYSSCWVNIDVVIFYIFEIKKTFMLRQRQWRRRNQMQKRYDKLFFSKLVLRTNFFVLFPCRFSLSVRV